MKHDVSELYTYNRHHNYSHDYIVANNIPVWHRGMGHLTEEYAHHQSYFGPTKNGKKTMITAEGKKTIYVYGEKTWFDTEAERDAYRANRNAEREEQQKKNALLATIMQHYEAMTIEQLEAATKEMQ